MNFFSSLVSSLTGVATPIPNFSFDFKLDDEEATSFTGAGNVTWTMRNGTRVGGSGGGGSAANSPASPVPPSPSSSGAADASGGGSSSDAVTIFSCCLGGGSDSFIQNALKRSKSLVAIPGVLKTLGTVEHEGKVWIATERCVPLRSVANSPLMFYRTEQSRAADEQADQDEEDIDEEEKFQVAVALGLHTLAGALGGLHRNSLVHLNVNRLESVFVTETGEWRLFGFELCGPADEAMSLLRNLPPDQSGGGGGGGGVAPELARGGSGSSDLSPADAWGLGALTKEVFSKAGGVPRGFLATVNSLTAKATNVRPSMQKFREQAEIFVQNRVVQLVVQLDELNLLNSAERDSVYRELAGAHGVRCLPQKLQQGVVLPKVTQMLQYGASGAALGCLLQIGAHLQPERFAQQVSPAIMTLFSSNEPVVRIQLLEHSPSYAHLLPATLVSEKIWPLYATGFTSKLPEIRERHIRSLPNFAGKLESRFESGDVTKAVMALQQDPQGAIRSNATICLAMLATNIPLDQRAKTLCNGLGRMLKDPFAPSRMAAVRAIGSLATEDESFFQPQMLCEQLLPAVSPLLLDPDSAVRTQASSTAQTLMKAALATAAQVPTSTQPQQEPQHSHQQQQQQQQQPLQHSSSETTPAGSTVTRSPVAPTERSLVFGAGKSSSSAAEDRIAPVAASKPKINNNNISSSSNHSKLPSSDLWDDISQATASKPAPPPAVKRVFKASSSSSNSTSSVPAPSSSSAESTATAADIQAIFGHAPSSSSATEPSPKEPEPVVFAPSSSTAAASSATTGGGMKLGGPKKRGFGIKGDKG